MATPSSSATSPSPPMPYLHHAPGPQQVPQPTAAATVERELRKKAVQKFLARAEVAMVTRALRARLSYASYKATHNIPHVPLRDLEAQSQSQAASFNRTVAAKRKAVGATHHYNTSIPGSSSTGAGAGSLRRGGSGSMAPPASVSSPRTHASSIHSATTYSGYPEVASGLRNASQAPNLYSSILAPPPAKQARTIHNPNDLPVPAPSRPHQSPRSRTVKASPRNDPARLQAKTKQPSKNAKAPPSPNRRRTKANSVDKGKQKQHPDDMNVDVDGERDLKAAATLTSLLLHHRPSIAGSASSPRSSIDGSDVGSVQSYSHFAQSSARTSATHAPAPLSAAPSSSTIIVEPPSRTQTPPPPTGSGSRQQTTPRAAPTDNEAASLMLFLATSPSPARPANKDSRDMAAFRALGGGAGALLSKGRVLFPSMPASDPAPSRQDEASAGTAATSYGAPALARGGESSFASSISSIGAELGGSKSGSPGSQNASTTPTPSTSAVGPPGYASPPHLLPPAHVPLPSAPTSPAGRTSSPRPSLTGVPGSGSNPGGPLDFNFHEFINASPSPSRGAQGGHGPGGGGAGGGHKPNLGLRADVGRKLFEEEQMRHAHALQAAAAAVGMGNPAHTQRQEERTLGAGINLVQQS